MAKKPKAKKKRKLSGKQRLFAEYYIQTWNATLAAKQAGYNAGSDQAFSVIGYQNLRKLHILERIEERLSETLMSSDEVLARLGNMARSFDMTKYIELKERFDIVTKTVTVKGVPTEKHYKEFAGYIILFDLPKLQEDGFSHLVKKVKQTSNGGIEIEWHNQMDALVHLGKHLQLFEAKLDITSKGRRITVIGFDHDNI